MTSPADWRPWTDVPDSKSSWTEDTVAEVGPCLTNKKHTTVSQAVFNKLQLILTQQMQLLQLRNTWYWIWSDKTQPNSRVKTHINGAAHQRVPLVRFHHNLEQIRRHILLHVKHLSNATCEVLHCLAGRSALQTLVGSMQPSSIKLLTVLTASMCTLDTRRKCTHRQWSLKWSSSPLWCFKPTRVRPK